MASAADYTIGTGNAIVVPDYQPGDNVTINMASGYFGSSAVRSQTFNDATITITSMVMNNGWGEAVTTFDPTTTVIGSGNLVLTTAGLAQDFVFAGNMQGYSGAMRIADRSGIGSAVGNAANSIIRFGGGTSGGTTARGVISTDFNGAFINHVAGTGALGDATGAVNQVVFNYAASNDYGRLIASNNINARYAVHSLGSASLHLTGTISGGAQLNQSGTGTLTLSGNHSYTGPTNVTAGTLVVNGSISTGAVTVGANGRLAGDGVIGGTATVGGTLSPGNSPGTLSFGSALSLAATSTLNFELNALDSTPGAGINDLITVGGNLTLDGILNVSSLAGDFATLTGGTWRLFDYAGTLTDNGLDLGTLPSLATGYSWEIDTAAPNRVQLSIVPEPKAWLAFSIGILLILGRRLSRS